MVNYTDLSRESGAIAGDLVELRRRLHRRPEIGLDLPQTQAEVLAALAGLGLEVSVGKGLSSVTAVLRGSQPGPAVLLRADMDALPVFEDTGLEFASENPGVMHACGHDLHTAMLVGGARLLAAHRQDLTGDVVFMFQPGEEGCDGARLMIDEGVLTASGQRVGAAYGMHVKSAGIPTGVFTTRPDTFMASNDDLTVVVKGAGGHGSAPHLAADPVPAAAAMVTALQTMVTRRFDVFDPVIVTVGMLAAGTRNNIIPGEARLDATVRSFSRTTRSRLADEILGVCEQTAAAHQVRAEVTYKQGYPVTVNDPVHAKFVQHTVTHVLGDAAFHLMSAPQPGAEDFSRVLEEVPGAYMFLGAACSDDPADCADNHSAQAVFDEAVLPAGALMHACLALGALENLARKSGS